MPRKEPLYPHVPRSKQPLFPHVTRSQQLLPVAPEVTELLPKEALQEIRQLIDKRISITKATDQIAEKYDIMPTSELHDWVLNELKKQVAIPKAEAGMPAKEPWQMTKKEWNRLPTAYRGISPGIDSDGTRSRIKGWLYVTPEKHIASFFAGEEGIVLEGKILRPDRLIADPEREESEGRKLTGIESFEYGAARITSNNFITKSHKDIVQQALSEGKPVPSEVLKDYPELTRR